MSFKNTT
jgi:transcription termination factor NusB